MVGCTVSCHGFLPVAGWSPPWRHRRGCDGRSRSDENSRQSGLKGVLRKFGGDVETGQDHGLCHLV
jgi:hypothetical protein